MKQDNLDQLIKDSLESVQPEVPAHLWDNIRAGIQPASPPADSAVHSGSASSGTFGSAGLLKLGAAAVALIGGGLLVWHLSTDTPEDKNSLSSVTTEQEDVRVPETTSDSKMQESADEVAVAAEDSEDNATVDNGVEPEASVSDKTVPESVNTESADASETEKSPVAEKPADIAGEDQNLAENEVSDQEAPVGVDNEEDSNSDDAGAVNSQENIAEESSDDYTESNEITEPFVLVEAGVLADKVSGEAPLSVNFSNTTIARSYDWNFDNGRRSTEASPYMTFNEPGDYTVRLTVTDYEGNEFSDLIEVSVYEAATLVVPNAFSPNGDGDNDYYFVQGTNIHSVKVKVFRLDGSLVFESEGMNDKWDGEDNQSPNADKYQVVVTAIRESGEPIFDKVFLHVFRD